VPVRVAGVVFLVACACAAEDRSIEAPHPSELVRAGAQVTTVRRADLDGDGGREIAVASVTPQEDGLAALHLEVFGAGHERWVRIFDAEAPAPPGAGGAPPTMIASAEGFVAQSVNVLEAADLDRERGAELVVGIASAGATAGPLELWILTVEGSGRFRTAFYGRTARGGRVTVDGDVVRFEVPVYRKEDPGCCPSVLEHQRIGLDPQSGRIAILERRRERL
jgi:hypothetical protein